MLPTHHWIILTGAALVVLSGCDDRSASAWTDPEPEQPSLGAVTQQNMYDYAVGVLEQAGASDHPQLRANALEGLHQAPELIKPYVRRALGDPNRGVRFVAAMTVGRLKQVDLAPLVEPLLYDEHDSVRAAAIYALRQCGRAVDMNPLSRMLQSSDPEVRGNVAVVLGEMGNPSAAPMIKQNVGQGMELTNPSRAKIVDLQFAEALVKLGDVDQIHAIRAALFLPPSDQELTALACVILGRLHDERAVASLFRLINVDGAERRPAEVRMAAVAALAEIGEPVGAELVAEYCRSTRLELRYQAAATLGAIGALPINRGRQALPMLSLLVDDPNPLVRVAAASAILKIERG